MQTLQRVEPIQPGELPRVQLVEPERILRTPFSTIVSADPERLGSWIEASRTVNAFGPRRPRSSNQGRSRDKFPRVSRLEVDAAWELAARAKASSPYISSASRARRPTSAESQDGSQPKGGSRAPSTSQPLDPLPLLSCGSAIPRTPRRSRKCGSAVSIRSGVDATSVPQ